MRKKRSGGASRRKFGMLKFLLYRLFPGGSPIFSVNYAKCTVDGSRIVMIVVLADDMEVSEKYKKFMNRMDEAAARAYLEYQKNKR